MIQLTKRSLLLTTIGAPLWLFSPLAATAYLGFVIILHSLDYILLPKHSEVSVQRILPQHFELNTPSTIEWRVSPEKGTLHDQFPEQTYLIDLDCGTATATFLPTKRGKFPLKSPSLTLKGNLSLINRTYTFTTTEEIKIYPTIRQSKQDISERYGTPNSSHNTKQKVRQHGGEFESLRPYIHGEDLRNVDWKISAKKGETICKNWETENDRHVTVLIDCGRMMAETVGKNSLLDFSLNATAQLSQQIQGKKDTFSLYAFSDRIVTSLPKTTNQSIMKHTLETIYQLQPELVESDYWQVMAQVMGRLTKRSLIVLFSNILDRPGSLGLINNLSKASEKHLVLCVTMKDPQLENFANSDDTYEKAAACHILLERQRAIKSMRHQGITVLEVSEKSYVAEVIQSYLNIREKI